MAQRGSASPSKKEIRERLQTIYDAMTRADAKVLWDEAATLVESPGGELGPPGGSVAHGGDQGKGEGPSVGKTVTRAVGPLPSGLAGLRPRPQPDQAALSFWRPRPR